MLIHLQQCKHHCRVCVDQGEYCTSQSRESVTEWDYILTVVVKLIDLFHYYFESINIVDFNENNGVGLSLCVEGFGVELKRSIPPQLLTWKTVGKSSAQKKKYDKSSSWLLDLMTTHL
ncbi:uncharacterized protein TM35_000212950 [Trypanosoma theileri]|uniref:Uncharacterized protein n=1 Tax=Trypanosoma theileri TaxID=67003 RepID=A0A1X0NU27_9TRYP|nr:uncharacterized protein TM35_000212950 [Trypanosoma theileri]ORC87689.1 hypothetical protein TM35_000212950 [Trypanosoma theileri]